MEQKCLSNMVVQYLEHIKYLSNVVVQSLKPWEHKYLKQCGSLVSVTLNSLLSNI